MHLPHHCLSILVMALVLVGSPWTPAPASAADAPRNAPKAKPAAVEYPGPLLKQFLAGPMADVKEIVFAVRVPGRDHWYVNFGNYASDQEQVERLAHKKADDVLWGYGEGGRLCRMELRTGKVTVLLDDPRGGVRDPQIHYDGRKILFSCRKGGEHPYHLYEIQCDGTGLVQLTDGPDDDIEPTYCPDGSIVFGSSRCRRFVNCWHTRVATLYRCDGDGKNIRMLSSNNDHDNTPWMLPDGRILYMRWEYVDRSQVHYHHLWTMNPDGSGQMVYFGNSIGGIAMLDAKPIPGTNKVVASFSPGHGRPEHLGPVTIVEPAQGPDVPASARAISKGGDWRDPFAISEECFLVASPKGLFVMDGQGNSELIYQLPPEERTLQCHEPRPLVGHPHEANIARRVNTAVSTGRAMLSDVYFGRNMSGVPRGSVKKLLVLQQLPKPVNFSGGMQPLTIGGSFTLAQILGTVPVEPDGSAYLELPALKSVFFVAMDGNDMPVKRMHSFLVVQPGETVGCTGCHESRTQAPPPQAKIAAFRRAPSRIQPLAGIPEVVDYPRHIQPIFDRACVECHRPERYDGRVDLTGDKTSMYTMSYWTIRQRELVSDARNQVLSDRPPYSEGTVASRLMKYLDVSHHGVKLAKEDVEKIRYWIETSATYPGTYAALGCGTYPVHFYVSALQQRCGVCHGHEVKDHYGKHYVYSFAGTPERAFNISRPEKSYALLAPLARESGGLALCKQTVFKSADDPLYKSLLAAVRDAHRRLEEGKRFDMPGFRPNASYLREMQRFGILPADLKPTDPVDPYVIDRKYWDSFDYRPHGEMKKDHQTRREGDKETASTGMSSS